MKKTLGLMILSFLMISSVVYADTATLDYTKIIDDNWVELGFLMGGGSIMVGDPMGWGGDTDRGFMTFNTSSIPDGATITSAVLQLTFESAVGPTAMRMSPLPQKTNLYSAEGVETACENSVWGNSFDMFSGATDGTIRNTTLESALVSAIQSNLSADFVAMCFKDNSAGFNDWVSFYESSWSPQTERRPVLYVTYTTGSSPTGTIPSYTGFSTEYGTTNFSAISDYTSVPFMTLATATDKIKWLNNVNVSGLNLTAIVRTGSKFISINAAQAPSMNTSANVTLNISGSGVDCSNFKLYYASSFYTTSADIISNGAVVATNSNVGGNCANSAICQNLACSNGIVTFTAMHFDGYAMGPGSTGLGANATLNVSNNAPTIVSVTSPPTTTLNSGTTKTIYAQFNASDENGAADLNSATAQITIYKSGETSRTSSGCSLLSSGTTWKAFNCTITMQFYDGAGSWNVNASISDTVGSQASDAAQTFTVNNLDSILLNQATIDFGASSPSTSNVAGTTEVISNTGNQLYTSTTLTGYALTSGSFVIDAPNFCGANASNPAMCNYLANNSAVAIPGISLTKGPAAQTSVYHYANIPGGSATGIYNAQSNWIYTLA